MLGRTLHDRLESLLRRQRRHQPRWPLLSELLREPSAALAEALITRRLDPDAALGLAEERYLPGEDEAIETLLEVFAERVEREPGAPGAGSSKLHGLVRAELSTTSDLPRRYRKGIFAEPRTYPGWACFSGPGLDGTPDIDASWLSPAADAYGPRLDIKLSNVPGPKLLQDEKHTQDLCSSGAPVSLTASVLDSAQLARWGRRHTPLFYFVDPRRQHLLELLMHALYAEPAQNPLERRYYGSGPLLLGQGQAMLFSLRPRATPRTRISNLPGRPPDDYLREAMVNTLAAEDVSFDLMIQPQTDPSAMPIEDAAVRWPERLSPWLAAGTLRINKQQFDSPEQRLFARRLRFTPWHALPEHRPLGSQHRARRRLYQELLALEQEWARGQARHNEPAGDEVCVTGPNPALEDESLRAPAESVAAPERSGFTGDRDARSGARPIESGARGAPELARARGRG
jgi:hypothetical protein